MIEGEDSDQESHPLLAPCKCKKKHPENNT